MFNLSTGMHRSSRAKVFCKKGVQPVTLLKKRHRYRCLPVILKNFKYTFFCGPPSVSAPTDTDKNNCIQ